MSDFEGKVALITGAGKGNGRALAEAFVDRQAFVAANDVSPVNLDELVQGSGEGSDPTSTTLPRRWLFRA